MILSLYFSSVIFTVMLFMIDDGSPKDVDIESITNEKIRNTIINLINISIENPPLGCTLRSLYVVTISVIPIFNLLVCAARISELIKNK